MSTAQTRPAAGTASLVHQAAADAPELARSTIKWLTYLPRTVRPMQMVKARPDVVNAIAAAWGSAQALNAALMQARSELSADPAMSAEITALDEAYRSTQGAGRSMAAEAGPVRLVRREPPGVRPAARTRAEAKAAEAAAAAAAPKTDDEAEVARWVQRYLDGDV